MQYLRSSTILLTVLSFALANAARADISQTTPLASGNALNLDTGAIVASGGDLLWNGSTITPQGKAKAYNLGNLGMAGFSSYSKDSLVYLSVIASSAPIASSVLVSGEVFAVFTNGANVAKVLVVSNSGGSITLQFVTFITTQPTGPAITAIKNNSSDIPSGFPSSGIAPSSIFVVQGTGLADPGAPALQSSADPGLPLTLNGVSLTVVVNNTTVHPALYYTSPAQLAAELPANTPVGSGTLTVDYRGTQIQAAIQVVPAAPGINTYYTNTGVATDNSTGALLTFTNSGSPGETIVLWTTGLGPDPADSDTVYSSAPHSVSTPLQVYIGGVAATVLYEGSAGYPGVDQIDLTIPDSAPSGCWISIVAVAAGVLSNVATLPINPGGGACVDVASGLSGNQIAPSGGQTLRAGLVALIQTNRTDKKGAVTVFNSTDAAFEKYTGIYAPANSLSPGGCLVTYLTPVPVPSITGLDPGTISLTGPNGLSVTLPNQLGIKGAFYSALSTTAIPSTGGTFTFQGSGGADVGSFTSTVTFANPIIAWTNKSVATTIDRSQDLTVTWTGGTPGSYVFIYGTSTLTGTAGTGTTTAGYTCLTTADAGKFTVPSHILSALPVGSGGTGIQNQVQSPLSASGLDIAIAIGDISFSVPSAFK